MAKRPGIGCFLLSGGVEISFGTSRGITEVLDWHLIAGSLMHIVAMDIVAGGSYLDNRI